MLVLSTKWQIFFHTVAGGDCTFEVVQPFLDQLLAGSGYVVCPGITEYPSVICFKTKKLRERGLPFKRVDSKMCSLWHLPNNVHIGVSLEISVYM